MDQRKITLAITTWNRYEMVLESFAQVQADPRIDEIIVLDDHSVDGSYEKLEANMNWEKVKLYRNDENIDCYRNKCRAVKLATNPWVVLLDSDNIINTDYLDR